MTFDGDSLNSLAFCAGASMPYAISKAFGRVSFASKRSRFWMLSLFIPTTKRSRRASFRNVLKSHVLASRLSSAK